MKSSKKLLVSVSLLLLGVMSLSACVKEPGAISNTQSAEDGTDTTQTVVIPEPDTQYSAEKYYILSKEDYVDKTTAGFLSQLVGFLSGFEFVKDVGTRCYVGMPDGWFKYCKGPYAADNVHIHLTDKHKKDKESGLYEVWFDDDFSVDVVNQYILSDMYRSSKTVTQKYISDGWLAYDVWDMGGGQRKVGAYGLINRYGYLPQFAGNTEFENWYSYLSEPYLGTDTLGMNAPGMPETARDMAEKFAQVTGDRDNVRWAQMFASMISMSYFEDDIETIIKKAASVFPEDCWPRQILNEVFALHAKYPNDWRTAYREFEARHYVAGDTTQTDTDINCGFVIFDLLYGGGDYLQTCKIGSLAGYDCESTCGIALTVLAIMGGTEILPEETNTLIWQDGNGTLCNRTSEGEKQDIWMIADGLPEKIKITAIIEKYQQNFEYVLLEHGGAMDEYYYYIPKEDLSQYDCVKINNYDFETGDTTGYTTKGKVEMTRLASTGFWAVKLSEGGEVSTKVSGLEVGKSYSLTSYIKTSTNGSAYLFARESDSVGVSASVHQTTGTPKYEAQSAVKRTLVFTATSAEMEIGVAFSGIGSEYAIADGFIMYRTEESSAGTVTVQNPSSDGKYTSKLSLGIKSSTKKEAYLKLKFANTNANAANLKIKVNGTSYATAALYKSSPTSYLKSADTVYIPLTLTSGSIIDITFSGSIYVYEAEFVNVTNRF